MSGWSSEEQGSTAAVSVRGLTKIYQKDQSPVHAVDDVSFEIEPGTVTGLLGPNGAGKTTTIKTILGLVIPTEGEVTIHGIDMGRESQMGYQYVSAMLEGTRNVYWRLTVRENLAYFARLGKADLQRIGDEHERLLERLNLAENADEPVNNLSRGMKQKVALACALARDTPVIFLDEPTLGLDVESSFELRDELRRLAEQESRTVVLSSHDMDVVADVCDRVIIMNDGRIIADDTIENLIELFRTQAYRIEVEDTIRPELRRAMERHCEIRDCREHGGQTTIEFQISTSEKFYAVMDALEQAEQSIASIHSVEPDLENVFLELTTEINADRSDR